MNRNKPMRCPYCKTVLVDGPLRLYETLDEHVMDPNNDSNTVRPTFKCLCTTGIYWDPSGAAYQEDFRAFRETGKKSLSALNSIWCDIDRAQVRRQFYRKIHIERLVSKLYILWLHIKSLWKHHKLAGHHLRKG